MSNLSADAQIQRVPNSSDIIERVLLQSTVYAGSLMHYGTAANSVAAPSADATTGFFGMMLEGGVSGQYRECLRQGKILLSVGYTVDAADQVGTVVYKVNDTTPSDNPADINETSTKNSPVGRIAAVRTVGASGTNRVEVLLQADGLRSV